MIACLIATTLLSTQSSETGPQFVTMGTSIYKIDRKTGGALHYFNGIEWEGEIAKGAMQNVFSAGFFVCTSVPSSGSTVITHYNRPTGTKWEPSPTRYADAGTFTPLLYGSPANSSKVFGIVGSGESARLCFFETKRRQLIISSPAFEVKKGWRSLLMVEEATAIINTPDGLKEVNLSGDNSGFTASTGSTLPTFPEGIATDANGNALIGAPMGNMFFFVDKKGQLGQIFRSSSRQWAYENQETPPRGWTLTTKSRPVTISNGVLAVQVQHKEKKLEGLAIKSFKSGGWHWNNPVLELPEGVKFSANIDLHKSSVGSGYDAVYGLAENGKFYRFIRTIGEPWKMEGGL